MPHPPLVLPEGEVHLWYTLQDEIADPSLLAAYHGLLNPQEQVRRSAYRFARHQHQYLVTRALVRTVLSRYADVAPGHWEFRANEYGRPEIAAPEGLPPIRFNLSNTEGLIVCAVALAREVGVDVENIGRAATTLEIADRFFAPAEVAALRALPAEAQTRRFFEYWTLKESYIKARGMGLALPLDRFWFLLAHEPSELQLPPPPARPEPVGGTPRAGIAAPPAPVRIAFAPDFGDDPGDWCFAQFQPTPRHLIASALGRGRGGGPPQGRFSMRRTVPLLD